MRLINTLTLELHEFLGDDIPPYAILSHTWGNEEVTIREWTEPTDATTSKPSYRKISLACRLAHRSGHSWLWADTICIDKTSSAELSEAINSMFSWYSNAEVCYAYLEDVTKDSLATISADDIEDDPDAVQATTATAPSEGRGGLGNSPLNPLVLSAFGRSRWFTRGWTLQELIAPAEVIFYTRDWVHLGTKLGLANVISSITGIRTDYLNWNYGQKTVVPKWLNASVAERMSWLAVRQTTRIEDMAYCMLGLFDVNMPLLYGEGAQAFVRLQHEIIRTTHDHSIFAWDQRPSAPGSQVPSPDLGMLAPSPSAFLHSSVFSRVTERCAMVPGNKLSPYSVTNLGLSITLFLLNPLFATPGLYIAVLDTHTKNDHHVQTGIAVQLDAGKEFGVRSPLFRTPLRLCEVARSQCDRGDMFLRVASPRERFRPLRSRVLAVQSSQTQFTDALSSRDRYGLLITCSGDILDLRARRLYAEPKEMQVHTNSVLNFPPLTAHVWKTVTPRPGVHVRTTGVLLGISKGRNFAKEILESVLHFIVTAVEEEPHAQASYTGRDASAETRRYRVFKHRLCSVPAGWTWSEFLDSAEHRANLDEELQRELGSAIESLDQPHRIATTENGMQYASSSNGVSLGCCDVGVPEYEEVRRVHIAWPKPD